MEVLGKVEKRKEIRAMQDEAAELRRRWQDIQDELKNLDASLGPEALYSALQALVQHLELESKALDRFLSL